MSVPSSKHDHLQQFERVCRDRHFAMTIQRRTVLEALVDGKAHPTADEVFSDVHPRIPGVSRTTVYRVLETLVQLEIIRKVYQPGAAALFDINTHQHHHLSCLSCGEIVDLEEQLAGTLVLPDLRDDGFEITESHIFFRGRCRECRGGKPKPP